MKQSIKHIYVIGGGAIGALYSWCLQKAGHIIYLQCRSNYDHIKEKGFYIHSKWGQERFRPDVLISHQDSVEKYLDHIDLMVLTNKVLDGSQDVLNPFSSIQVPLLVIQNGIKVESSYLKYDNFHLITAAPFVCVSQFEVGMIDHQSFGMLVIGDYPKGVSSHTRFLADSFTSVGVKIRVSEDIQRFKWEKLLWNAPLNPLSVLESKNINELLSDPVIWDRSYLIMKEVLLLANADQYYFDDHIIEKKLEISKTMPAYQTSMLLDYQAGRSLEIDAILGNAIEFARTKKIFVPELNRLYQQIKAFINS